MIDRTTRLSSGVHQSHPLSPQGGGGSSWRFVLQRYGRTGPCMGGRLYSPPPRGGEPRGAVGGYGGGVRNPPPMAEERCFHGGWAREGGELRWESPALYKGAGRLVGMWWWGEARGGGRKS